MEGYLHMEAHITEDGYPDWITTDMKSAGEFEIRKGHDYAAEVREKHQATISDGSYKPPAGERVRVVRKTKAPKAD